MNQISSPLVIPDYLLVPADQDAYSFLEREDIGRKSSYLAAIRLALADGYTPQQIGDFYREVLGFDREAMALRMEQAARHILRTEQVEVKDQERKPAVTAIPADRRLVPRHN